IDRFSSEFNKTCCPDFANLGLIRCFSTNNALSSRLYLDKSRYFKSGKLLATSFDIASISSSSSSIRVKGTPFILRANLMREDISISVFLALRSQELVFLFILPTVLQSLNAVSNHRCFFESLGVYFFT